MSLVVVLLVVVLGALSAHLVLQPLQPLLRATSASPSVPCTPAPVVSEPAWQVAWMVPELAGRQALTWQAVATTVVPTWYHPALLPRRQQLLAPRMLGRQAQSYCRLQQHVTAVHTTWL